MLERHPYCSSTAMRALRLVDGASFSERQRQDSQLYRQRALFEQACAAQSGGPPSSLPRWRKLPSIQALEGGVTSGSHGAPSLADSDRFAAPVRYGSIGPSNDYCRRSRRMDAVGRTLTFAFGRGRPQKDNRACRIRTLERLQLPTATSGRAIHRLTTWAHAFAGNRALRRRQERQHEGACIDARPDAGQQQKRTHELAMQKYGLGRRRSQ